MNRTKFIVNRIENAGFTQLAQDVENGLKILPTLSITTQRRALKQLTRKMEVIPEPWQHEILVVIDDMDVACC